MRMSIKKYKNVIKNSVMNNKKKFDLLKESGIIVDLKTCRNTDEKSCGTGVVTYVGGKTYDFNNIKEEDITIENIASSLSKQCRYNGNTYVFYSVAQHCVEMSKAALLGYGDIDLALGCLLHDAGEHVISDIVSPQKQLLPEIFSKIEDALDLMIFKKFGIENQFKNPMIKFIDVTITNLEMELYLNRGHKKNVEDLAIGIEDQNIDDYIIKNGLDKDYKLYSEDGKFGIVDSMYHELAKESFLTQFMILNFLKKKYSNKELFTKFGSHLKNNV